MGLVVDPVVNRCQAPVPRLMIRQIVLENFKSYGGVKALMFVELC